jgi:hypothetical protein
MKFLGDSRDLESVVSSRSSVGVGFVRLLPPEPPFIARVRVSRVARHPTGEAKAAALDKDILGVFQMGGPAVACVKPFDASVNL